MISVNQISKGWKKKYFGQQLTTNQPLTFFALEPDGTYGTFTEFSPQMIQSLDFRIGSVAKVILSNLDNKPHKVVLSPDNTEGFILPQQTASKKVVVGSLIGLALVILLITFKA